MQMLDITLVHTSRSCVYATCTYKICLKGHRQRISTVRYKKIFRQINTEEFFLPFTVITNKDYFSGKKINLRNLLWWYM